jgi:hypothetical protein
MKARKVPGRWEQSITQAFHQYRDQFARCKVMKGSTSEQHGRGTEGTVIKSGQPSDVLSTEMIKLCLWSNKVEMLRLSF